jgi:uncharacterized repeat protein (TIGR03803 family)
VQTYRLAALMLAALASSTLGGGAARAENFSVLYTFTGAPDGGEPYVALINVGGTLYGTTRDGGAANMGAVFTITPAGVESVLYSFKGGIDGEMPQASLINVGGILYGTTTAGGNNGCGTVFTVTPAGVETVLYAFKCSTKNDGAGPRAGLINVGGTLYGTTFGGGSDNLGTVFKVTKAGNETVVHSFGAAGDGNYPIAGLINVGGRLYGTTFEGGVNDLGTVFTISPAGKESVLYAFQSSNDANTPFAPLLDVGGTLYGTSEFGGGNLCEKGSTSCGAVFTITPSGHEAVLYSFQGKPDGEYPIAGLINVNGTLYGTTLGGGAGRNCGAAGCGTIFKLTTAGVETIVQSLSPDDGIFPVASLLKLGHLLYGTAYEGGDNGSGNGTVFTVVHH